MAICIYCYKDFEPKRDDSDKRFCCYLHKNNWRYKHEPKYRAKIKERNYKRYFKIRDTPEYKKKRKETFRIWRANNRLKHNAMMNIITKRNNKKRMVYRRKNGLCTWCGGKRDSIYSYCGKCRKDRRERENNPNIKEGKKLWNKKHKEWRIEYNRKYKQKNREKINAYMRNYNAKKG